MCIAQPEVAYSKDSDEKTELKAIGMGPRKSLIVALGCVGRQVARVESIVMGIADTGETIRTTNTVITAIGRRKADESAEELEREGRL